MEGKKKAIFQNPFLLFFSFFLSWVIKTKEDERKEKKEGVLEGCLLFSFLLFCLFSQGFFYLWFWCKFGCVFVLWGFDYFWIREIFNCDFVWTLRGIRVGSDTALSLGLHFFVFIYWIYVFQIIHTFSVYMLQHW